MKTANPRHTKQTAVTVVAQFRSIIETATVIVLKYRKAWREHATYRAGVDAQLAEWTDKHGTRPVMYSVHPEGQTVIVGRIY